MDFEERVAKALEEMSERNERVMKNFFYRIGYKGIVGYENDLGKKVFTDDELKVYESYNYTNLETGTTTFTVNERDFYIFRFFATGDNPGTTTYQNISLKRIS